MFVAGLKTASTRERSTSVASASGSRPSSRRPSASRGTSLDPSSAAGSVGLSLNTPITSPASSPHAGLPNSPPPERAAPPLEAVPRPMEVDERDREFEELVENLRGALMPKGGKGKVWLFGAERKDFRILLVDKGVRLPMRKINPTTTSADSAPPTPHSPLSPMTPSSPLYPDGLIAPVWVRKHAKLVPSVFVLFLRLFESPNHSDGQELSADEAQKKEAGDREREKAEDELLVREIGERRRRLGERGIKLTVVLMASASTLDSPALDPRLSYLRRASALSSKASLFVLTPVPADQLPDFVQSLQDALYDSAMEYYTTHAKRVRRKRARVPVNQLEMTADMSGRALGPQGWAVRYDWKAAWFAEVRGELDVARRHYEDCWNELARMFASTQTLPPRTKRWAEAKVLADCVAVKICKVLLYEGEGLKVLTPFFVHLKRFGDLSRGWGIGEETFEFWSWIARQYRIFADLLELAIQSGLRIPALAPPTFPTAAASAAPPASDYFCTPISSGNPLQVLQQPAFYFYTAACCSVQRQKRFEEALAAEFDQDSSEAGAASGYVSTAPGFANEKKVDHAALVIELFTKAYSLLKDQDYPQTRMALFVAFRIAETYCQSGQHEMAMRFFDRISPSFRRERWQPIVRQIRGLWYECAQRTDSIETAARIVFEMMCPGSGIGGEERNALKDDLISLFKTTAPSTTEPIVFDMADLPLLDVRAGFWQSTAVLSDTAAFKVVLTCPETVNISNLGFSAMYISFSDGRPDVVVAASGSADFVFVGVVKQTGATDAAEASLRWNANRSLVISGTLPSDVEGEVSISGVKLVLNEGVWNVQLVFSPHDLEDWLTPNGVLAPIQDLSSSVMFQPQPHLITLAVTHQASAYVDESFDLLVKVENRDEREMDIRLSVFLQPADEEDSASISMDDQESRSLLKDIPLAILNPKTSVEKVVHLRSPHPGTKIIDFSLHSIVSWASSPNLAPDSRSEQTNRAEEVNHTAVIPVLAPFECVFAVSYRQSGSASASGGDAVVSTTIRAPGPRAVHAESLKVRAKEGNEAEIRSCSLEQTISESFPQTWDRSTSFSVMSKFAILPGCKPSSLAVQTSSPAELVLLWRSDDTAILTETVVALPPLMLPPQESFVTPLLLPPASVRLHASFPLILRVRNSHPTLSASRLSVQVDTAEAFVWHGSRSARISEILPGETGELRLEMMAVGGTGWFALPRVKVWDGEGERRSEIKVLNGRAQENAGIGKDGLLVLVRP